MLLIVALAVLSGLLAGWAQGGRLVAIGEARLRLLWLAPVALGLQLVLVRAIGSDVPWWALPLHGGSYALLLGVAVANRRSFGMPLIALGLLLNATVIALNGGLMPQAPQTARLRHAESSLTIGGHLPGTKDVLLARESSRLWWLSDFVVIPTGGQRPIVASPGDLILGAGLAATVYGLMRPPAGGVALTSTRRHVKGVLA